MAATAPTGGGTLPTPSRNTASSPAAGLRPEAASHSIELIRRSECRVGHAGEFPTEIVHLHFIQPIRVRCGHQEIVSCSPFVRPL